MTPRDVNQQLKASAFLPFPNSLYLGEEGSTMVRHALGALLQQTATVLGAPGGHQRNCRQRCPSASWRLLQELQAQHSRPTPTRGSQSRLAP